MSTSKYLLGISSGLFVTSLFAAVPVVFQAGTTAQASQVNQNFADLDGRLEVHQAEINTLLARVADLESRPERPQPVQVYANGQSIGNLLQYQYANIDYGFGYAVINEKGFIFSVQASENPDTSGSQAGALGRGYSRLYESAGCVGPAFTRTNPDGTIANLGLARQGVVIRLFDAAGGRVLYYVKTNDSPHPLSIRSSIDDAAGCENRPDPITIDSVLPTFPNDPAVTGVPNESFPAPINLGQ